jgi:hypothetical protein
MSDAVTPAFGGFVEVTLRSGWRGLLRVDDVDFVVPRKEGGTSIRCKSLRTILVDVPIEQVIAAMRKAGSLLRSGRERASGA